MRTHTSTLGLHAALALLLALSGCASGRHGSAVTGPTDPVRLLRSAKGDDPANGTLGAWLIKSDEQLDQIGSGELARLQVDFAEESLIVVALGEQPTSGYSLRITGVSRAGDDLFVQGVSTRPAEGDETLATQTCPYAAAVIARTSAVRVLPEIEMDGPDG